MAPEILNNTLNVNCFESFKAADMYCLGLVLWEVARRTVTSQKLVNINTTTTQPQFIGYSISQLCLQTDEPQLPYYDVLPTDPNHQEVFLAVCVKKIRPHHSPRWQQW